jgi:competence protein ComEC
MKRATMKVWNVELGLAIHIKAPNGKYVVIDLGSTESVSPLKSLMSCDVGYMIITHPHHDHFSDIQNINLVKPDVFWRVKDYSRNELLECARDKERYDFVRYCDFCDKYIAPVPETKSPSSGFLFDGMTVHVFNTRNCDKANKNNFSAIAVIQLGNAKIVVCGDNEKDSFSELMQNKDFVEAISNAWVLVAPHHGRESGYHEEFVKKVNPYITIISDTSKVDTTAADSYSNHSKGYKVYKVSCDESVERKCLTTRKDGNILVEFGESTPDYLGYLNVITGVK